MADILMYRNQQIGIAGPADASELPYDSNMSTKGKIDAIDKEYGVQFGIVEITGVSANWNTYSVTFSPAFVERPMVSVSQWDTRDPTNWSIPMIKDIDKTGFKFGWYNASGSRYVIWQAFGRTK